MHRNVYEHFGVPTVVNCVGYATRVGGSCPSGAVLQAMDEANRSFVEIDDLQRAASRVIARTTHAEAGIVTCGAAAAMTLAAATCLAGSDIDAMDRLPDTSGLVRNEIIYPSVGPFGYEHPVRLSGARLVEVSYEQANSLETIERAISEKTAAIGYAWHTVSEKPDVSALARLAHHHNLPLIVDAAMALPPVTNLHSFIERGADLVAFSGGKHLQGPQASGILCGRTDLIRSAWVQMVDMDVREGTWSLGDWMAQGWITRPPRHGIGRAMKVGKEAILGLMTALEAYELRNHECELKQWHRLIDEIAEGLSRLAWIRIEKLFPCPNGQPFPALRLGVAPGRNLETTGFIQQLRRSNPKIILAEDEANSERAYIYPMCLFNGDPARIVAAFRALEDTG